MEELNKKLEILHNSKDWQSAVDVVSSVCKLFGLKMTEEPFLFQHPKINAHTGWFMNASGFVNRSAAYEIVHNNKNLDIKLYWATKVSKTNLSWMVGISPNFEDAKTFESDKYNIGLDIVIPKECDRIILLVSNKYKVRSFELKEKLSRTDREIIEKLQSLSEKPTQTVKEKQLFHNTLWDAFNFEPINRKFYKELVDRFTVLRDHLVTEGFDNQDAVMFSTRLIGRILFTWFLRKKNLINEKVGYFDAGDAYNQTTYYKEKLEKLFFETLNTEIIERGFDDVVTPYLNGGLFEASRTDFYSDRKLTIPDGFFSKFFEVLSHYNFTVDESSPEFEQVAVDPEMLGRIFESLLAEQRTETGEQARKAKGAFYTPREIVSYMCEQSLKEYLKTKITEDSYSEVRIEEIVSMSETVFRDQDHNKRRDWKPYVESMTKALDELTIFDPAVGSGAYPMGMLHLLVKVYTRLDSKYEKNLSKLKRSILSRSLFGSDIDITAIEICRLRAWLSLIVDIEEGEQVVPLPNLEFHFVCANTLISLNKQSALADSPDLRNKMKEIRESYYNTNSRNLKETLKKRYEKLLNPSQASLLSENDNVLKTYQPFSHESKASFFDPELMFGINKFDILIGNPPYIKEHTSRDAFDGIRTSEYYQGKMDLWYFFACHLLDLLKINNGILTFIATNNWVTNAGGSKFRKKISEEAQIVSLIDFNNHKIFESADIQTMIMIFKKNNQLPKYHFDYRRVLDNKFELESLNEILNKIPNSKFQYLCPVFERSYFNDKTFIFNDDKDAEILNKIHNRGNFFINGEEEIMSGIDVLQDFVNKQSLKKLGNNFKVGDGVFVLSNQEKNNLKLSEKETLLLKPYYSSKELRPIFGNNKNNFWIIYTNSSFKEKNKINDFPKIKQHLDKFKEIITSENGPYGLNRPREERFFQGEKIMSLRKCITPTFSYTDFDCYVSRAFFSIKTNRVNQKYLTAILNSKVVAYWLKNKGKMQGNIYQVDKDPLLEIPIFVCSEKEQKEIISMVDKIISIKKLNENKETVDLENQINELVMDFYQLTDKEKGIIRKVNLN